MSAMAATACEFLAALALFVALFAIPLERYGVAFSFVFIAFALSLLALAYTTPLAAKETDE